MKSVVYLAPLYYCLSEQGGTDKIKLSAAGWRFCIDDRCYRMYLEEEEDGEGEKKRQFQTRDDCLSTQTGRWWRWGKKGASRLPLFWKEETVKKNISGKINSSCLFFSKSVCLCLSKLRWRAAATTTNKYSVLCSQLSARSMYHATSRLIWAATYSQEHS